MKVRPSTNPGKVTIELELKDDVILDKLQPASRGGPIFKIKKILVPVDFSDCSLKALAYAIPFAREFGATINVLHVIPPYYAIDPYGMSDYRTIERGLRVTGEQKLANLVLDRIPQSVPAETFLRTGRAANEIIQAAKELESDVIIIATHGHTGLKHSLIGSTAEDVVRRAPCPVLTVRENEHEFVETKV